MEKINEIILSEGVSTHIRHGFFGWQAGFSIDHQTFHLQQVSAEIGDAEDTEEKAKWYQSNLEIALKRLMNKGGSSL